jgi:hypothetical protein
MASTFYFPPQMWLRVSPAVRPQGLEIARRRKNQGGGLGFPAVLPRSPPCADFGQLSAQIGPLGRTRPVGAVGATFVPFVSDGSEVCLWLCYMSSWVAWTAESSTHIVRNLMANVCAGVACKPERRLQIGCRVLSLVVWVGELSACLGCNLEAAVVAMFWFSVSFFLINWPIL